MNISILHLKFDNAYEYVARIYTLRMQKRIPHSHETPSVCTFAVLLSIQSKRSIAEQGFYIWCKTSFIRAIASSSLSLTKESLK